jgi:hypothetical protein
MLGSSLHALCKKSKWIPAFAGMTGMGFVGMTEMEFVG